MNREDFFLARSRNLDDLSAQLRHWIDTVNPRVSRGDGDAGHVARALSAMRHRRHAR